MKKILLLLIVVILALPVDGLAEPVRAQGISMQMLPERIAKLNGQRWGFWVDYADYLVPEPAQPVLQTPIEFTSYVSKQKPEVKANGVWITLFNPGAYKIEEEDLLERIRNASKKIGVELFFCSYEGGDASCEKQ
jgi:hypothetical protein